MDGYADGGRAFLVVILSRVAVGTAMSSGCCRTVGFGLAKGFHRIGYGVSRAPRFLACYRFARNNGERVFLMLILPCFCCQRLGDCCVLVALTF